MEKNILVTGGAGFLGHHLIEHLLRNTKSRIVCLDRLDVSGNLNRLTDIEVWEKERKRVRVLFHDLKAPIADQLARQIGKIEVIVHLAAGTHVDRSITDPVSFVMDNVVGTTHLLEYARTLDSLERMIYFSTDEVFGSAPAGTNYKEWDRYNSRNPYSASKAGGEEMCLAYHNTYKVPVFITHTMNLFGERQHPEKFLPLVVNKLLKKEKITIHADVTKATSGSRFYIHARNVAAAIVFLCYRAKLGDKYNIVGEIEVSNLEMALIVAQILSKPLDYELVDFHSSRPGHDLRYALDGSKMEAMGWKIPVPFEKSIENTVRWMVDHPFWLL